MQKTAEFINVAVIWKDEAQLSKQKIEHFKEKNDYKREVSLVNDSLRALRIVSKATKN